MVAEQNIVSIFIAYTPLQLIKNFGQILSKQEWILFLETVL